MTDYSELVIDLRDADTAMMNWKRLSLDAVAAIEELQAKVPHWVSVEQPPKKEGKYFVAYRSIVVDGWRYDTAYYTKHLEDKQLMIPAPENSEGWFNWSDYDDCDVLVSPDYWMPIDLPKEEN